MTATVNDRKRPVDTNADEIADYYNPTILSATDYYPFGMDMPNRTFNAGDYRFGFNGKEADRNGEWGSLNHYDYGFRIYNPGIAKFLSVDPLTRSYPWYTPYQFAGNMPIWAIDLDGLEPVVEDGVIIGYTVYAGQGPTQIAGDINDSRTQKKHGFTLVRPIRWEEIIDNKFNTGWFDHISPKGRYNRFNAEYKYLNLNPGETVNIFAASRQNRPAPSLRIDLQSDDITLFNQTLTLMRQFSPQHRLNGGEFVESGRYDLSNFIRGTAALEKDRLIDFYFGHPDGYGYKTYRKTIMIGESPINLIFSIPRGNKLASSEEEGNNRLVTYGMLYDDGGKSRHITVDFGRDSALFNRARQFMLGQISAEEFLINSPKR